MIRNNSGPGSDRGIGRECRRFLVWGRVQGVWFRESTRREALRLGLVGHAINLEDGSVEVVAAGGPAELNKLAEWLHRGPPLAQVSQVIEETAADPGVENFTTA